MKNNHSFTECYYHFVFVTRFRNKFLFENETNEMIEFECNKLHCVPTAINFGSDHIHLLVELHPSVSVSEFACKLKSNLSKNLNKLYPWWPGFQTGYSAFTIGNSDLKKVQKYIQNQ
jgi:putative transposase